MKKGPELLEKKVLLQIKWKDERSVEFRSVEVRS
jgi:hypothetical protein